MGRRYDDDYFEGEYSPDAVFDSIDRLIRYDQPFQAEHFYLFGCSALMAMMLPQALKVIRTAHVFGGFPFGGFVRGYVNRLFGEKKTYGDGYLYSRLSRVSGDLNLWFRDQEKATKFVNKLKKVEVAAGWRVKYPVAHEATLAFYPSETIVLEVPFCYRGRDNVTWFLVAFRITATVAKECIPVGDMSANCLIYDIKTERFESCHPRYTASQLVDHILKKEIKQLSRYNKNVYW